MRYVYSENGQTSDGKIYNEADVLQKLAEMNQLIFSSNILTNLEALATYHFYPLRTQESPDITPQQYAYGERQYSAPYVNGNTWYIDVTYTITNPLKLQQAWQQERNLRDAALREVDWIESSTIVTEDTKERYRAYRQLLRDAINCVQFPWQVRLPVAPPIYTVMENDVVPQLDATTLNQLKDYKPAQEDKTAWKSFLNEWSKFYFTANSRVVNNLLLVWMHKTLDTLFNEPTT